MNLQQLYRYLSLDALHVTWTDVAEIIILSFIIYQILIWIKTTRAWSLLKGFSVIMALLAVAAIFHMNTILWIAKNFFSLGIMAVIVVFQPELRRALEQLGENNLLTTIVPFDSSRKEELSISDRTISELVKASFEMGKARTGALMVLEQSVSLNEYERTGIAIDSLVSSQLILNIFEKNTPLHDGAVIIDENRVVAATCYLPLSDSSSLSKDLGTRHRAGLGISEVSDCIVVIVSEETGSISIAKEGKLIRYADASILKNELIKAQDKEEVKPRRFLKGRGRNEKDVNETKDVSDK